MRELSKIEQEIIDHLVVCWRDPQQPVTEAFFSALKSIPMQTRDGALLYALAVDEIARLRTGNYRSGFANGMAYRFQLERRIAQRQWGVAPYVASPSEFERQITPPHSAVGSKPINTGIASKTDGIPTTSASGPSGTLPMPAFREDTYERMTETQLEEMRSYLAQFPESAVRLLSEFDRLGEQLLYERRRTRLVTIGARRMDIALLISVPQGRDEGSCWHCGQRILASIQARCPVCREYICSCGMCDRECRFGKPLEGGHNVSVSPLYSLCQNISETVRDYRKDEIDPISPEHVERWVSQFEQRDRLTILQEMDRILRTHYISAQKAEDITRDLLASEDVFGADLSNGISTTAFLDIQRKGSSQRDLLAITDKILLADHHIHLATPSTPSQYIYLDDCLFSGATVFYDIENWLATAPSEAKLWLIFWAGHTAGRAYYIEQRLRGLPKAKQMDIQVRFLEREFANDPNCYNAYECLWPCAIHDDVNVNNYVEQVQESADSKGWPTRIFRDSATIPSRETLFSSPGARSVVERAFLKAGAHIFNLPENPKLQMRPMGYEVLESLGFGAMFVTYRNISNNCPLVLWWGDPNFPDSHPFSKWQPLFPRKTNHPTTSNAVTSGSQTDIDSGETDWQPDDEVPF